MAAMMREICNDARAPPGDAEKSPGHAMQDRLFAPPRERLPPAEAVREMLGALTATGEAENASIVRVLRPLLEGNGDTAAVPDGSLTAALLEQLYAAPAASSRGFFLRTGSECGGGARRRGIRLSQEAANDALVVLYGAIRCPRLLARMRERAAVDPALQWAMASLAGQYPAVLGPDDRLADGCPPTANGRLVPVRTAQ